MKIAAIIIPMARCKPLPPRILRPDIMAPIMDRINTEAGVADRLYRSAFKVLRPSFPRILPTLFRDRYKM
jgi:hypothetical protein